MSQAGDGHTRLKRIQIRLKDVSIRKDILQVGMAVWSVHIPSGSARPSSAPIRLGIFDRRAEAPWAESASVMDLRFLGWLFSILR